MEYLAGFEKEVAPMLSSNQREECNIIESIIMHQDQSKDESIIHDVIEYMNKRKPENCKEFIFRCIERSANIRPKARRFLISLIESILKVFGINPQKLNEYSVIMSMLQVKGTYQKDKYTNEYIFDFAGDATIGKAIFEDDIEQLKQLLAMEDDYKKNQTINIEEFFSKLKQVYSKLQLCSDLLNASNI